MFGLVDCNNFFVSCERLFRPDLIKRPVAVLSSNDGCIVARSQEVKDLGVQMGVPLFEVRDLCTKNGVVLFSSNFALYHDISRRVMNAIKAEFGLCDVYSVDEAFVTIEEQFSYDDIVKRRLNIIRNTGIPVSIGIAQTKTLAKLANSIAKKTNGVHVFTKDAFRDEITDVPCGAVWGVGRKTTTFFIKNGVKTIGEILSLDSSFVRSALGVVGERLIMELSGKSVHGMGDGVRSEQETYTSTRSFPNVVKDKQVLLSALAFHTEMAAHKLRQNGVLARKVGIVLRGGFDDKSSPKRSHHLETDLLVPTNSTEIILKEVGRLLNANYKSTIRYKKAGVILGNIQPVFSASKSLFSEAQNDVDLSSVRDSVNTRFGKGTITSGVALYENKWLDRHDHRSPEYTTKWRDIKTIKAI